MPARAIILLQLLLASAAHCGERQAETTEPRSETQAAQAPSVRTGAAMLVDSAFEQLDGSRVALIANQTTRVGDTHLADLVHDASNIDLVAIFAPEHGFRGTEDAGATVADTHDERTGAPIYSLYGANRAPSNAQLDGVDVLVFDIQDIGARFYTYISTMGLAMQAAARSGIRFMVLDRPNPLGGTYVSGFVLDPAYRSFVGQYTIPVAHGLTVAELARMVAGEPLIDDVDDLEIEVVPMTGWTRTMRWPDTALEWIATSPNIPDFETALVYPGMCFFEGTTFSEGRGTHSPFRLVGGPDSNGSEAAATLNNRKLPGVVFTDSVAVPRSIDGMAANPKFQDRSIHGVVVHVSDADAYQPIENGLHVLEVLLAQARSRGDDPLVARSLDRLSGSNRLYRMLADGATATEIAAAWADEVDDFRRRRQPYLLYD